MSSLVQSYNHDDVGYWEPTHRPLIRPGSQIDELIQTGVVTGCVLATGALMAVVFAVQGIHHGLRTVLQLHDGWDFVRRHNNR